MAYYKSGGINVTSNSNVSINTASGPIASFNTNLSMPVLETKATINPVQNGTPWIDSNEVNKEPYIKRAVAGTATRIGNQLYDKLVGGTVAFNQAVSGFYSNRSTINVSGNSVTVTSDGRTYYFGVTIRTGNAVAFKPLANHKYFTAYKIKDVSVTNLRGITFSGGFTANSLIGTISNFSGEGEYSGFFIGKGDTIIYLNASILNEETSLTTDIFIIENLNIIDLTAMFGSTIADYIYSLEQATAGAGVAWFKALFPNDYYAYNAGELMSVKATAHVMKNASNQVIGNYALDSNLELRGLFKLDANNKLYADGDTYESSGLVTRNYKKYTFTGNEGWTQYSAGSGVWYCSALDDALYERNKLVICSGKYLGMMSNDGANIRDNYPDKVCVLQNTSTYKRLYLKDTSLTSQAEVQAAVTGMSIVYPIATPTTEQASPFTNPQVCDENGTEEYTDSRAVAIPVGHETYQANICPITGFDELNIQQTGVNLWDEEWVVANEDIDTTTGEIVPTYGSGNIFFRSKNFIPIEAGKTYFDHNGMLTLGNYRLFYYDTDKNYLSYISHPNNTTFTTPVNARYMLFRFSATADTVYQDNISINSISTDTQYHSYSGKLIKLEFDDTVYLAEVSCLNGVWKLKLLGAEIDLGDLTWTAFSNDRWGAHLSEAKTPPDNSTLAEIISDRYSVATINSFLTTGNDKIGLSFNGYVICRNGSTVDTPTGQLHYQLATPTEITLDETEQFEALLGVNNVWHDGNGNTEVKYRKVNT